MSSRVKVLLVLIGVGTIVGTTIFAIRLLTADEVLMAGPSAASRFSAPLRITTLILAMLLGILSSFVAQRIQARAPNESINIGSEVKSILSSSAFIGALIVAPIVFNGMYVTLSQNPQGVTDFVLAYQNGFFWQSIFARMQGAQQAARPQTPQEVH